MDLITQIAAAGAAIIAAVMTLLEALPIKTAPWSAIFKWIGKKITESTRTELKAMKAEVAETRSLITEHVVQDGAREANQRRRSILNFNNEILRDIPHTKEEFIDILQDIDDYERYCCENPDYKNNRAALAINNIRDVYKARLKKHDFLPPSTYHRGPGLFARLFHQY